MTVTMTGPEVAEAIRQWIADHGGPSEAQFTFTTPNGSVGPDAITVRFTVECSHMEGPYR